MRRVITVDGPAASGKSTVARKLAQGLGFQYINSGAFYRTMALALARLSVRLDDQSAVERALDGVTVEVSTEEERTFLNGEDVTEEIRTKEVSDHASRVARLPVVRARVNAQLRRIASSADCVIDGRDIGSAVFPHADFKLYLEASLEERSRRRLLDYERAGRKARLEDIQSELAARDAADSTRAVAPLQQPEGATVINSTGHSVDQVVSSLMSMARAAFTPNPK
ncbi:MAG: (d)CMP kinase [Candidatus Riflebacteria bacterium]|nr:(d)CMP kinase [Candidatus Riflebacteria bacterium]